MKTQASERARRRAKWYGKRARYTARNKAGNRQLYVGGLSGEPCPNVRGHDIARLKKQMSVYGEYRYNLVLAREWKPPYRFEIVE